MDKKLKIALFLIFFFGVFYVFNHKKQNTPYGIEIDNYQYPILGIDLSEYSGNVNFSSLQNEVDVDFIYLRTSAGQDYKDQNFEKNYRNAIENKYLVGFYHYYRFNEDPIKQAEFFLQHIEDKRKSLPLVIDVEEWGNNPGGKTIGKISEEIKLFVSFIKKKIKINVMIYTNESGYKTYIENKIKDNYIWICSFKRDVKINNNWLFWQYSHKGKFRSVDGWVDLNTFNGDKKEWENFIGIGQ